MPYTISQCANMIEARVQFHSFTAGQSQWAQASSMWFLDHTQTYYTRQDSAERVTGESQRPIPDKRQTSKPTAGFEPAIPAIERLQACALDRAATGIGGQLYM